MNKPSSLKALPDTMRIGQKVRKMEACEENEVSIKRSMFKMKKIFLYGHTGSANKGCEAIVRSTVKVLSCEPEQCYLMSFLPEQDAVMADEIGIHLLSYENNSTKFHQLLFAGLRKLKIMPCAGFSSRAKQMLDLISREDICLTIGGDTYCYDPIPWMNSACANFTKSNYIQNILWCCSIERDKLSNEMIHELKKYSYIFVREALSYDTLMEAGFNKEQLVKCCDPAFFMNRKQVELPSHFEYGNTVGINVSGFVIKENNNAVYQGIVKLIRDILKTGMSVCLIPHVYAEKGADYEILESMRHEVGSEKVFSIPPVYDCEQLKYVISQCRFFVGARTHSTIAAYSSCIPTLALGYSVKSKGIATDLFGTYKGYVLPYDEIFDVHAISEAFFDIVKQEEEIKTRLREFLPQYTKTLTDAVERYISI